MKDKIAIITGGSKSIGFAIAEILAEQGATAVLVARNEEQLKAAVGKLPGEGHSYVAADLSKEGAMGRVIDSTVKKYGRLDVLVNSAGMLFEAPFTETDYSKFVKLYQLNVFAVFEGCKVAGQYMLKQGSGTIVNLSSLAGRIPYPDEAAYGSSKAAVTHMTRIMAAELRESPVAVYAIAPGSVDTEMLRKHMESRRDHFEKLIGKPLEEYYKKILKPRDIAEKTLDVIENPQKYTSPLIEMPAEEF